MIDLTAPQLSQFRAILLGSMDQYRPDQPERIWTLHNGPDSLQCLIPCSGLLYRLLSSPLKSLGFQLAGWPATQEATLPVVVGARPDAFGNDSLDLLPPDICPVPDVHGDTVALIRQIMTPPLRGMVEAVFQDREVVSRYWTMPASARHHHAFPGGLAAHSLEVAQDMAGQAALESHERDLCIGAGLLHDIGKVWSYTPDMFLNAAARAMGHELVGLCWMERELKTLEKEWPDGAYAMRVLLSGVGRMRKDGSMPSALVARLKAADQHSCEQERHARTPSRIWAPTQWQPRVNPDEE